MNLRRKTIFRKATGSGRSFRKSEEKLRWEKKFTDKFISSLPGVFYLYDDQLKLRRWNRNFEIVIGYSPEELVKMQPLELIVPEDRDIVEEGIRETFARGRSMVEARILTKSGAMIPYILTGGRVELDRIPHLVGMGVDITERVRGEEGRLKLERRAQHTRRLENLGVLVGGIAHDFNNLLSAVTGNISLARILLEQNDTAGLSRSLEETDRAAMRATKLASQLLTYARGGAPVLKIIDSRGLIEESVKFALNGSNVRVEFEIPDDLLPIRADDGQLNQVFSNLALNARQAMPEGGTFQVICENILIEDEAAGPGRRGRYLRVTLRDKGCGIPPKLIPRIFEPFFSTKDNGYGLGLANCHSIIKRHGGWIEVESPPGQGTTFTIHLPATEDEISERRIP
ncbi:MAG TPA: PAS domain S-box protein [Proteobacteria bacterium]|nr:PAS domain S-box protein [Pseudomonadota bacterium]